MNLVNKKSSLEYHCWASVYEVALLLMDGFILTLQVTRLRNASAVVIRSNIVLLEARTQRTKLSYRVGFQSIIFT